MNPPEPLKRAVRAVLDRVGLEVRLRQSDRWLSALDIRTVLDIGANTGQFAAEIAGVLPEARIYSFEPIPDSFAALQRRFAASSRVRCFPVAIGDAPGRLVMHQDRFSPSSSLLEMAPLHRDAFPYTGTSSPREVEVMTLDAAVEPLEMAPELLVKIDVQGYEDRVIRGGIETLKAARAVIVEVNFRPLYHGQGSFEEVYSVLTGLGLTYRGNRDQLPSPIDGGILSGDVVFVRD